MVTFELKSGDRSQLRPDASGKLIHPIKGKFIFPTEWLAYQISQSNVWVDDHDLFVSEVSKGKFLLMDILTKLKVYMYYDYVTLDSEKGNNVVECFMLPEGRGVYPRIDDKQGFPCLEKLQIANDGTQLGCHHHTSPFSFNRAMEGYFLNYGLVLKRYDLKDRVIGDRVLYKLEDCVKDWMRADEIRAAQRKQEAILAKRKKKIPNWVVLPSENNAVRTSYF